MRSCPEWFERELTRIGGTNQHGEPVFRLVWSQDERWVIGGKWAHGFAGYKEVPLSTGEPCWMLMVWEPCEVQGSFEQWDRDYRDEETGLLQCGGYPKYGRYRILRKFIHQEVVQQAKERLYMVKGEPRSEVLSKYKLRTYRMEPNGLMLDLLIPMLMAWQKLSNSARIQVLRDQERQRKEQFTKKVADCRAGHRINRGSQLVQKRAEIIDKGMARAMAVAAQYGLGMRLEA